MANQPEFARLTIAANEAEAEMIRALLQTEGIVSTQQMTSFGAGMTDGIGPGGAREILVRALDLQAAQALLAES